MSDTTEAEKKTPGQLHEERLGRLLVQIEALPPKAQAFARHYRMLVDLCGRIGPGGSSIVMSEGFILDLQEVLDEAWQRAVGGKVADHRSHGPGH